MKVLKDFKTVNQVFKVGDEFYDDVQGLENWVSRGFVAAEQFVDGVVIAPATPVAAPATPVATTATTEVPTATFA